MIAARGTALRPAACAVLLAFPLALALGSARGLAQPPSCSPAATHLCLAGDRFQAEVAWTVPGLGSGPGQAVPMTADTGSFWFFSSSNLELTVKVLDGRAVNRHFWVFYGGLSNVEYTLTITDLRTGAREIFNNPQGRFVSASDTAAFDPEAAPAGAARAGSPAAASPAEAPLRLGSEFQVNVTTAGDQILPAVAAAPDGSFMVVWTGDPSSGQADGPTGVFGRIYDAAGNPRTAEIRLNETPLGYQPQARVAANAAGEFMVVWSERLVDARTGWVRLFGADGHALGELIQLNTGTDFVSTPDVTADPAGGFLVAWNEYSSDLSILNMVAQRFDAQGGRVVGPVGFSAQASLDGPRLAPSPRGGFLAVWAAVNPRVDSPVSDLWAQRLDASGRPVGDPFVINSETRPLPGAVEVAPPVFYADGGFAVLWRQIALYGSPMDGLYARRYAADGSPAGGIVAIRSDPSAAASAPAAIALPSGDTWVLWHQAGTPAAPGSGGIYSGVFDPSWTLQGDVTRVNTYASPPDVQVDPAVAAAAGSVVAVWASGALPGVVPTQDGSGFGVFGQRFTTAGCALASNQLCLGGRFRVEVRFIDPRSGRQGTGQAIPLTGDTGTFWFFDPANLELMIKILDGRAVNGHFWVFYGALSDVDYTITVTDTATGANRTYRNAAGHLGSGADVDAFPAAAGIH